MSKMPKTKILRKKNVKLGADGNVWVLTVFWGANRNKQSGEGAY